MNSRVHPKYKTKYSVGNWRKYERALVRRGDVTIWLSADAIDAWKPARFWRRGAQRKFSDHAIETGLTLRLVFRLPLRQTEGFLRRWCANAAPPARTGDILAVLTPERTRSSACSRVHPKYKTKYRVGNWPEYERSLVQRGDVTLWLSADAIAAWKPAPSGRRGGQRKFSDCAIETALTLRLVFRLPLRQAEGFLRSVLSMMRVDLDLPDHTTLSRRSQHLDVEFHRVPATGPIHLIVDATGLSTIGEGEWAAVKHGGRGRRAAGLRGSGALVSAGG